MFAEVLFFYVYDKRFIYQSIAAVASYFSLKVYFFIQARKRRYRLFKQYGIPGPEPSLVGGSIDELMKNEALFKSDEQFCKRFGKVYGIFIGDEPSLVITDLDILKKVFLEATSSFTERSNLFLDSPIADGILFARYPRWKLMRKIMSPAFSGYTIRGDSATQFIEKSVKLMLEYIDKKQNDNGTTEIDFHDLMKSTALHLITAMSINLPNVQVKEKEENVKSLDDYLETADHGVVLFAIKFPFILPIIQFVADRFEHSKTLGMIHKNLNAIIDKNLIKLSSESFNEHKSVSPEQYQLFELLIKLHHEGKVTRREILGNAEALLFAGYDTTSTTLTYIFWVLSKYPSTQEELRDEIKAHGIESKLLERVIHETMRLYPTVVSFTTRVATQTVQVNSLTIPQGTRVVYNAWLMHRDPDSWPNPEIFDPSRFNEENVIHPCAFAPFGLGDRRCLGYQLALLEMKTVICELLLNHELELKSPQNLKLVTHAFALTKPKEKVILKLRKL